MPRSAAAPPARNGRPKAAPDWYKDAVIYEVHVRAFRDSGGDGVGDFRGLTEKLDYLADLGVTALWLLPFFPSPGRDDGYDTSDYTAVHPDYGTLADVRTFVAEAHRRGLKVITEVVLNHTSDQHLWFQRARRAPAGSPWREFYVWSDTPDRYPEARVIFRDFETSNWTWDPVAGANFWHRFYSHQPDLNYENPRVRQQMLRVMDFWLGLGMDGLRLDAVPYLYEADGTNCENLPATHAFLREVRRHVDERYGDRMLLAEANQWPEDAVAYFGAGAGDECHMAFQFPLMPRIFMALRTEDRFPILDILEQTPAIPETAQWAIFLRNHDELTLEMVTDAERDYMYRAYASDPAARINLGIRRRLAPLVGTRRKLELLNGLLFSLPGTPVLYYGDEIGMGDNYYLGDRNAVRTPMQWSPDRNAGFSEANRQRLYLPLVVDPEYHFEAVNVAAQAANPSSLLWWMKRVIGLRRHHPALARGTFEVVSTPNRQVLAFRREYEDETIVVVANLSRYAQWCELDLARDEGRRVVELFGGTVFPAVTARPYALTVGPHSFLWFRLETADQGADHPPILSPAPDDTPAGLVAAGGGRGSPLATALARRLARDPGYRLQGPITSSTRVTASFDLEIPRRHAALFLVTAETRAGESLTVPLVVEVTESPDAAARRPDAIIARLRDRGAAEDRGTLIDAAGDPRVARALAARAVEEPTGPARASRLRGHPYELGRVGERRRGAIGVHTDRRWAGSQAARRGDRSGSIESTSVPRLDLVGRVDPAPHPEIVTAHALLAAGVAVEPVVAALEVTIAGRPAVVGVAVAAEPTNRATFAEEAAASLDRFLDAALAREMPATLERLSAASLVAGPALEDDGFLTEALAEVTIAAHQAGESLAALHDGLAHPIGPAPEPYTSMSRRALYQAARTLLGEVVDALRDAATTDEESGRVPDPLAAALVASRPALDTRFRVVVGRHLDGLRIATYGPPVSASRLVRLGNGFAIGAPGPDFRAAVDRRRIRSPFLDVAAVLASLRHVALSPVRGPEAERRFRAEEAGRLEAWARAWWIHVGGAFVASYVAGLARPALIPSAAADRELLLDLVLAEVSLEDVLGSLRAGIRPDPTALLGLVDLAGVAPATART